MDEQLRERLALKTRQASTLVQFESREQALGPASLRHPGERGKQLVIPDGSPLLDVEIHEQDIHPAEKTRSQRVEVPGLVPAQSVGIEPAKPILLLGPKTRLTIRNLDLALGDRDKTVWDRMPGGAPGNLLEA